MLHVLDLKVDEDTVIAFGEMLDRNGFEYDADFTTLYGAGWTVVGLRVTNLTAIQLVQREWRAYTIGQ